jgi:hypothetical protein
MATVAKGYDLDYVWRAVGESHQGAGYYLAAAEAGSRRGRGGDQAPSSWVSSRDNRWSGSSTICCSASGRGLTA